MMMMVYIGTMSKVPRFSKNQDEKISYLFDDNVVENNVTVIVTDDIVVRGGDVIHNHQFPDESRIHQNVCRQI